MNPKSDKNGDGRSIEFTGKNVEDAIANGLKALGVERNAVQIEILSHGSRGLLGLGAELARIRIHLPSERKEEALAVAGEPATTKVAFAPAEAPPGEIAPTRPEPEKPSKDIWRKEIEAAGREVLEGILAHMGIRAKVVAQKPTGAVEGEEQPVILDLVGDDLGILIGRQGETLAALQYLVRLMTSHKTHRWANVVVDVEGYKARREQTLRSLAMRMADRVSFTRQPVVLEAMPAYERRIIHLALRDHPTVTTQSVGEGNHRRVTIIPKQG